MCLEAVGFKRRTGDMLFRYGNDARIALAPLPTKPRPGKLALELGGEMNGDYGGVHVRLTRGLNGSPAFF